MVGVVSYKMFPMVDACKKEDGRETVVISETWILVKLQMLLFKLSMCAKSYKQRLEALVYSKFKERAAFPKCETTEEF